MVAFKSLISLTVIAAAVVAAANYSASPITKLTELTVGLIRVPPNWPLPLANKNWTGVIFNISQTVDAGIELIQQAKKNGAGLVAFPELWFLGPEWIRITAAVKKEAIWTALGFVERKGDRIFMAQALISAAGEIVIHRHKLRPSGSERDIFSDGTISELQVLNTDIGRVGMLKHAEHWYPSMTYPMAMERPKLHIGNFPYVLDADDESNNHWFRAGVFKAASASYAFLSGAHVLLPAVGHSVIVDPYTNTVAESRAKNSFADLPILYSAFNDASLLCSDETSDADAQVSWNTLQQIKEAVPDAVPQVTGSLVPHHEYSVIQLKAVNFTWNETDNPSEYDFEGFFVKAEFIAVFEPIGRLPVGMLIRRIGRWLNAVLRPCSNSMKFE